MSAEPPNPGYALPSSMAPLSAAAAFARAATLPANVSCYELPKSRAVINQHNLPSCVSSALAAALEVLNAGWPRLAPLFHYYVTRFERGGADSQGFLYLFDSLITLEEAGICRNALHQVTFDEAGAKTKPTPEAFADALTRAFGPARSFDGADFYQQYDGSTDLSRAVWIREQLRQGRPVIVGFLLPTRYHQSFLNSRFEWLNPNVPLSGKGHCVLVRGYDDLRQAFHIQDSRGENAFEQGCWWMGYRVVDSSVLQEAYCLTR